MKKINLLEVRGRLGLGGTEKNMQLISKYLDRSIFNVFACVSVLGGEREKAFRRMGIKIYHIKTPKEFGGFIRKKNIDVVHFHASEKHNHAFIKAAHEVGVSAIILMDNAGKMFDSEINKLIDRHMISKMIAARYKKTYKMSDEEFHRNCRVLYCLVDFDEINRVRLSLDEIVRERRKLGITKDNLVIGGIGRPDVSKWGNFYNIIPHLVKKVPNVKYLVMGVPPSIKEEIKRRNLGKYFVFLKTNPSDEAVMRFYQLIDIYALSSSSGGESFGLTIAEAMAHKKPVVSRSTPLADNAQVELVDNSKTGFVVYSSEAFADAIARLAIDKKLARKMGQAGFVKAKREYEAKTITRMLEKRVLEILTGGGLKIPESISRKYKHIRQVPSKKDIDDFEDEYWRRLHDCFGRPNIAEIFAGRHVIWSPSMVNFFRRIGVAKIRNFIKNDSRSRITKQRWQR